MLKVLLKFSDKFDETQMFYPGDLIEVEDKEREKDLIERGIVTKAIPFILKNPKQETKELTVKEIKSLLDEKGIEYDKKSSKDELLKLLEGVE